jgi:hypothetical protein
LIDGAVKTKGNSGSVEKNIHFKQINNLGFEFEKKIARVIEEN